jgi:hypothetical protein
VRLYFRATNPPAQQSAPYLPISTIIFLLPGFVCFTWQNLSHVDSAHLQKVSAWLPQSSLSFPARSKIHWAGLNLRIPAVKTLRTVTGRASAQSARTILLTIGCLAFAGPLLSQQPAATAKSGGAPNKLYLQGERPLGVSYAGAPAAVAALAAGQLKPLALASGDLDGDGVEDLVAGYASATGGVLVIHRGNLDAFAPQSQASWQAIAEGRFPSPFLPEANVIELPETPDFLAIGNFIGNGDLDVVVGARGSHTLYILAGDGKGGLLAPRAIMLTGALTVLAATHFASSTAYSHIVAGTTAQTGSNLVVFEGTASGISAIANAALRAPATSLAFGSLSGDPFTDLAVIAGGELQIVHGRDVHAARIGEGPANLQPEPVSIPFAAASVTVGSFIQDRASRLQMAVLGTDGSVHIVTRARLDTRPWSLGELQSRRRARLNRQPDPLAIAVDPREGWQVAESFPGVVSAANSSQPPILFRTRISSRGSDDVMILDTKLAQMHVIGHESTQAAESATASLPPSFHSTLTMSASGGTAAGIPMRVNIDGRPGVVVLKQGESAPQVMMPLPDPTFFPNRFDDITPRGTGVTCLNTGGVDGTMDCTLREAIIKANATAGTDTIMLQAGTYTLTLPRSAADHHSSLTGTLEVQDSLNIIGTMDVSGNPTSIVQGGTSLATSVDKVFSFNEDIDFFTDATVSISNLVIQNGRNQGNTTITDGWGGAFDFDTGLSGNNTLTVTNCNITTNTLTEGEGGGFAVFNSNNGTGFAQITNSTVQNNTVKPSSPNGTAGTGGGIFVGTPAAIVMNNSKVLNNSATQNANGVPIGGGMNIVGPSANAGQNAIHGSTISGNSAALTGGGISNTATLLIDSTTVISGNTSGTQGGGLYTNALSPDTVTISKVTITGNSAVGSGGGIALLNGSGTANLTIGFSRLAGNTAPSGSNLSNAGGTVIATNNWWGTNSASGTINIVGGDTTTFDPFIVLTNVASPNLIGIADTSTVTASFLQDNHGTAIAVSNLNVLIGLPVLPQSPLTIFPDSPVHGTLSGVQTNIQANGQATETFTATSGGIETIHAVIDQASVPATITVLIPPSISKAFSATHIPVFSTNPVTATLTFTITNPNTANAVHGLAFTDNLPPGLAVANTPNVVNGCGGTVTASAGAGVIVLSGGTANQSTNCTVAVDVKGVSDGVQNNTTGNVTVTDAGGLTGNTASAVITVINPPHIVKAFGAVSIPLGATTSLTITVSSTNAILPLNGVAFTDTLPAGVIVATPSGLSSTCGGSATASGGSVSLLGATLVAGSSCTVSLNVQGTTVGVANNSVTVSDITAGTGNTSTAPLTVVKADTTTAVTSSVNPSVSGQSVTFTATVSPVAPGAGNPTGTVTFLDGGSPIGTGTLASGVATFTTSALAVGSHTLTTSYSGDTNFNGSTGSLTGNPQVVSKAITATAVISSVNPTVFGQSVTFTATVSPVAPGAGTPTGTVTFLDGGSPIGTGTLSAGVATFTTSALAVGSHTITTSYGGDGNFNGSTGSLTGNPQVVNKANTTTAVTSSQNPSSVGQPVTFTATVSPAAPGAGTLTGTVTFLDGGSPIGTGTLSAGVATFTTSALAAGNHTITTSYGGDGSFNGNTGSLIGNPQVVNKANTATTVTSSLNPSVFGQSLTFTATVSPVAPATGTATGTVTFLDGGSPIGTGTLSAGVATFTTSALAAGSHTITTSYGGDASFNGSTGSLTGNPQVVNKANTTTAITSSQNPSVFSQSVTFTATVSAIAPGAGTATGTVTFLDGGSPIGTGTLAGGVATFTTSALVTGNHTITTSYGGDGNFNGSTGSLTGNPQVVNKANTTTAVTSSSNPSALGQPVTFTATVSAVAPGAGTPTGTVTFLDGGSPIGTGTLSAGIATFTTSALATGNHTITTSYGGDGNFNGSTGSLTGNPQVVNKANTTTAVTSSLNPSALAQPVTFTATVSAVAPGAGTPTGIVTFLDGGSPIGTGTLSGGVATFTTSALAAGSHTITTSYGGDGNFNGSTGALTGNPQVILTAPIVTKGFAPAVIAPNGVSAMTITITNPVSNPVVLTGLAITDNFPSNLLVATPNGLTNTCGGTATAAAGSAIVTLTGGSVAVNSSCTVRVNVTGTVSGTYTNTTGVVSSTNGGTGNTATANVTVASPPVITKTFGATTLPLTGSTSLSFTISNPVANAIALTGVAFTDNLPAGLVVSTPNALTGTCGAGTITALAGSSSVSLAGATLATSSSCTFSVSVTAVTGGVKNNSVQVSSANGGTGNTSSATVTATTAPIITKTFGAASIPLNGSTSLSFTIQNNNATQSLSGVGFTDALPAGLTVSTPNGLAGTCGAGTVTATQGTAAISLTGATLAASGSCTFAVNVTGITAGTQNNTTGKVTSTEGGAGGTASASVVVVAPPSIVKAFNPTAVSPNGNSTLSFTITNPAANTAALAGVAFTDTLPAGITVATPNSLSGSCGGGTITATAGSGAVSLTGATIAAGTSCTFSVSVIGANPGVSTNTTGAVSSTNGGTGNTATANLTVATPPSITKAFGAASVGLAGSTSLTFTISNPNASIALAGAAFTDALPAGLVVATPNGLTGTCGTGTITAVAGSTSVTLVGGTIATSGKCSFAVNVTAVAAGNQVNTTGSISATNGGTGNTATASINVLAPDLTITKSHSSNFFQGETGATYTITANNIGAGPTAGTVTVTDTLPAGLTATAMSGTGWTCTVATLTCTRTDALASAASYPPITLTVSVAASAAASVTNIATVAGGGEINITNDTAMDITIITIPPDFTLAITPASIAIRAGQPAQYGITVTPINNAFTNLINFTVTGLPGRTSFVFSPASVTPGLNPATSTLKILTTPGDPFLAQNSERTRLPLYAMFLPFAGLVLSGFGFGKRKLARKWVLAVAIFVCSGLAFYGCASAGNFQKLGTPPGTYTVTVTATSGSLQHSAPVTLVVTP